MTRWPNEPTQPARPLRRARRRGALVAVLGAALVGGSLALAAIERPGAATTPAAQPMTVPAELAARTRFEPSAVAFVPERGRFLVVSDDTGFPHRDEHAPYLFWMDPAGRIDPNPLVIAGIDEMRDVEGLTARPGGGFYLVSSQSASKRGKRATSRTLFLRLEWDAAGPGTGALRVTGEQSLLTLVAAGGPAAWAALGLAPRAPRLKRPGPHGFDRVLDVEGLTVAPDGAVLFGLKSPRDPEGRALVWRLVDPARVFAGTATDFPLAVFGRVALPVPHGGRDHEGGISGLLALPDGGLWLLATIPEKGVRAGALFAVAGPLRAGAWEARRLRTFDGDKPEGLCLGPGADEVTIVFDNDAAPPRFLTLTR